MREQTSFNRSWDHALPWASPAIMVMLAGEKGVDLGAGLIVVGMAIVVSGMLWGGRVALAPMLGIMVAALAWPGDGVTPGLTATTMIAAAAAAGALMALAGATRLGGLALVLAGRGPVDGLRLVLGLWMAARGATWVRQTNLPYGPDSWLTAGLIALFLIAVWRLDRRWVVGVVILVGAALAWWKNPNVASHVTLGWSWPRWAPPTWPEIRPVLWSLAIPQALLALADLQAPLLRKHAAQPHEARSESETEIGEAERERLSALPVRWRVATVGGVVALIAASLGAAPIHLLDSARGRKLQSPAIERLACVLAGALVILAGLVLAPSLMTWCAAMPGSVLGVLALVIGVQLALPALLETTWRSSTVALLTAAVALATGHLGWAILIGWAGGLVIGSGRDRSAPEQ